MANPLLSEVPFGSYLIYSPRGSSEVSRKSRQVRDAVKAGHGPSLQNIIARLARDFPGSELEAVLGTDVTLVPTPRSCVLVEGALWPARRVADEIVSAGLARQVLICLERIEAVPKSAFARPGERPTARRQYDTMRAQADVAATGRITLVDDFVTKGNTLLAGASLLAEVFPSVRISTFALVRTKGLQPEVDHIVEPCIGRIRRMWDEADREP